MNHLLKGMLFLLLLTLSACANYDKKELIGNWEGPHWKFNFQEDGLLDLSKDGNQLGTRRVYQYLKDDVEDDMRGSSTKREVLVITKSA